MFGFGCFKKYIWYLPPFFQNFCDDPGDQFYLPNRETKKE